MVNYQTSKLYTITSESTNFVYVGMTTKVLSNRLGQHKVDYKLYKKGTRNFSPCYEIMKFHVVRITLLENYPCNSKDELISRQMYWITKTPYCINLHFDAAINNSPIIKCICGKQYYESNKKRHLRSFDHLDGMNAEMDWIKHQEYRIKKDLEAFNKLKSQANDYLISRCYKSK